MIIQGITITSLETITGFDPVSGALRLILDELQDTTISNTEDKQEITGKNGRKLNNLKRNKGVTISGTSGLLEGNLMEVQTGGTLENKTTEVLWTDYLTVTSGAATTNYIAVGTTGAEIEELYIRNADGTLGTKLVQDSAAAAGKFAYAPATKALTFHTDVANGTEIVVYYKRKITANVMTNDADHFSEKLVLYIDALGEDNCNNIYHIQFFIPKADFSGEFDIEMGDNQTTHDFEAESLAGACVSGNKNILWTYTVFGANTADVTG